MTTWQIWLAIAGLALVTLITRAFFLLFGERVEIPLPMQRAIRYAPAAALVAIMVPEIFFPDNQISLGNFQWNTPHVFGALCAVLGFYIRRSMVVTILAGMLGYGLIRWFLL